MEEGYFACVEERAADKERCAEPLCILAIDQKWMANLGELGADLVGAARHGLALEERSGWEGSKALPVGLGWQPIWSGPPDCLSLEEALLAQFAVTAALFARRDAIDQGEVELLDLAIGKETHQLIAHGWRLRQQKYTCGLSVEAVD